MSKESLKNVDAGQLYLEVQGELADGVSMPIDVDRSPVDVLKSQIAGMITLVDFGQVSASAQGFVPDVRLVSISAYAQKHGMPREEVRRLREFLTGYAEAMDWTFDGGTAPARVRISDLARRPAED
jgi:hypothetical protein